VTYFAVRRETHGMSGSGTKRAFRYVCYSSASGAKADISQRLADNRDL